MKLPNFIFVVLIISFSAMSNAQQVTVLGNTSCGEWVGTRATKDQPGISNNAWLIDKAWLNGFLSGINVGDLSHDLLKNADNESIYLWLDNYCNSNPLGSVSEGAAILSRELSKKKKK